MEDPATHTLWAGTREGICILDETKPEAGWQKYEGIDDCKLSFCRSISTDQHGNIWLGTLNNGIIQIDTNTSPFRLWQLSLNPGLNLCYINSILTNDGCHFWLGLSPYGIALYNRETHSTLYNKEIPGFEDIKDWMLSTSITHIIQRHNGEIWFANNSFGIIIKKKDAKSMVINTGNVSYLKDSYVNTLFEDRNRNIWIGQRGGVSVVYPDNTGRIMQLKEGRYDFSNCDVRHITQDRKGTIWIATDNEGIIRATGDPRKPGSMKYKQYNPTHGNLVIEDMLNCMEDSKRRLWYLEQRRTLYI